jgi:uncharacterized protein
MAGWRLIAREALVPTPWRNGMGVSRDLAAARGPDGALLWQIGLAELERDAPFSDYPHCDRLFTPVDGAEPSLSFEGGPYRPCPALVPVAFPGDVPTAMRIGGRAQAFNLIWDRRRHRGSVAVLLLAPGAAIEVPDAPVIAIHCVAGRLGVAGELLGPGDTALGHDGGIPGAAAEESVAILAELRPL